MKKRVLVIPIVLVCLLMMVGCAILGIGTGQTPTMTQPYSALNTSKGKIAALYSIYNKQYEDYKAQVVRKDLTAIDKQNLKEKKAIMIKVYPAIQAVDLAFIEGRPWDTANEQLAITYLRQLGASIQ